MNTFRQQINAYRLTLSFSLVLVLVCFFGSQVAGRADQQSLSIASQLWYSVAAHQTCLGKRISDNNAFDHDLDDLPSIITGNNHSLPHVKASGNEYPLAQHLAPAERSYQHPLLRAPPSA